MPNAETVLNTARSQLGVHEAPPNSNRVLYSIWYNLIGPWCDMFVSWCAYKAGVDKYVGKFAYTPSHESYLRSKGYEVSIRSAQPGDIVFFNFIGRTSHVGWVESNRGDGLITIEGNTNGSGSRDGGTVMRHFRSWNSGIVSVFRPPYTNKPVKLNELQKLFIWLKSDLLARKMPFLKQGDTGPDVKRLQQLLSRPQTGTFGPGTVIQLTAFQKFTGLKSNHYGRANRKTWRQLIYYNFTKGRL